MTTQTFDNSETTARLMLQHYVQFVTSDIGDSIEAILLVGSLATGSYVPGPSDIDQITILRDCVSEESESRVIECIEATKSKFGQLLKPTMEEMRAYHKRWRMWGSEFAKRHPEFQGLQSPVSPRIAVQIILSRAIFHYYYATGRTCFNKHQIASRLRAEVPNYQFQEGVELATRVRTSSFENISDETLESLNRWSKRWNFVGQCC